MGTLAITVTQASLSVVGAMVVVVVVVAALEVHTPAPRRRATRLVLPRVIEGSLEDLPEVDFAGVGRIEPIPAAQVASPVEAEPEAGEEITVVLEPVTVLELVGVSEESPAEESPIEELSSEESSIDEPVAEVVPFGDEPVTELVPVVRMERWAGEVVAGAEAILRGGSELAGPPTEPVEIVPVPVAAGAHGPSEAVEEPHAGVREPGGASTTVWVVGVDVPDGAVTELGEPGSDRDLAGVLFAAYVVAGGAERSRVTGWVTPRDVPPSQPAMEHGTRLRGRPSRIRDLLACDDEGRNWVTLHPSVDIRRGVQRRAPVDPVLVGLLRWWTAATGSEARVPADGVGELCDGIEAVFDRVGPNPVAPTAGHLLALARAAREQGAGLRIESLSRAALDARRARSPEVATSAGDEVPGAQLVGSDS